MPATLPRTQKGMFNSRPQSKWDVEDIPWCLYIPLYPSRYPAVSAAGAADIQSWPEVINQAYVIPDNKSYLSFCKPRSFSRREIWPWVIDWTLPVFFPFRSQMLYVDWKTSSFHL